MASVGHWNAPRNEGDDEPWDYVVLGGAFLPGTAKVRVKLNSDLDTKKPKGAKQASIADKGDKPSKIDIELTLVDQADLDMLEAQLVNLRPQSKGEGRKPLEIVHPNPNFWGITAVTVDDVDADHPDAAEGWRITLSCLEWAPEPVAVKPGGNKQKPKGDTDIGSWGQFRDDDVAGSGAPAENDAALENLGLPDSRAN
jgi:hypothetical protein